MKRNAADIAFSNFIRERDNFTCTKCGKYYPEGHRQGLHCSHIWRRHHQSVRYHSRNAKTLCFHCHRWYAGDAAESGPWVRNYIDSKYGAGAAEELEQRKNKTWPRKKKEIPEIAKHWRKQLEYMRRCRDEGREFHVMEWD